MARTVSQSDGFWVVSGTGGYYATRAESARVAAQLDAADATPATPTAEARQEISVAALESVALLRGGTANDLTFGIDDTGRAVGSLFAATETLGLFVAVSPSRYPDGAAQSMSPMEILGQAEDKVWVRVDKLSRPLKAQPTLYLGCVGSPLASSGLSPSNGFLSLPYMADMFGNTLDGLNPSMEIILTAHAPDPLPPGGDFGGALGAEASAAVAEGDIVRIQADGMVVPAIADDDANLAKVLGVAANRASLEDEARHAVIVAYAGWRTFNPEAEVTIAPGDRLYVSATEAGKVTHLAPAHARQVGICTSNDPSGVQGLVRI
jgi:hypothetical protein